ncbi:MAG: hypothetical protein CVU42_10630 [Chloroflexi bacterium HGW-Chloroflexi-4]|jgi:hypothetical protein|nr:MAG: hypothetical protein CVU42_10630 [Chloroflexi bacterium HGW-Chloroflexi-4]
MLNREINIPKALHELHGEKAKLSSLVLVYLTALVVGGIALWQMLPLGLPAWKVILAVVLFFDIGGGAAANLTSSTNQYYQKKASLRPIFLAMHVVHPLVLMLVFPQNTWFLFFVMVYTLGSAFGVNLIKNREMQQTAAGALVALGVSLAVLFPVSFAFIYVFAPLFMVKLILGFAVKRPDFSVN